jgi:hypothetical protein
MNDALRKAVMIAGNHAARWNPNKGADKLMRRAKRAQQTQPKRTWHTNFINF